MPPKTIASVINNESNLRILEKLKKKPYYPRELAAEMKVSEPFIVRRLKAMEEFGIVEGRWETENGRKVKRYYPLDITMQLGKDGLKVTSGEARYTGDIDMKKEATRALIYLPFIALIFCGYFFSIPIIIVLSLVLCLWQAAVNVVFYRTYPYMTLVTATIILVSFLMSFTFALTIEYAHVNILLPNDYIGLAYALVGIVFFMSFIYHIRFSQIEAKDLKGDKKDFIEDLGSMPVPVKIFYLPMVVRWKINEYFGLL